MHWKRVLSALVLIPLFLLLVQFGPPLLFSLVVGAVIALAAWEFARLCPVGAEPSLALLTVLGSLTWYATVLWTGDLAGALALIAGAGLLRALLPRRELRVGILQAAWLVLGVAYVGGLLSFASLLRGLYDGRQLLYYLVFATWAGDSGAYYVGSQLGRHRLAPRISPGKSVEGVVGGVLATVLVAALGSRWLWPRIPWGPAALAGVLLALAGLAGDLCESAVKRAAAVKDSGNLIPGHGGALDRLDSLMFAAAMLYGLIWVGWL
jgi:phosphatidate cytidylyltransferase